MRTLGRIILFVVGAAAICFSVSFIKNSWDEMSKLGWEEFYKSPEKIVHIVSIVVNAITVLFGLGSILCAFRRKMSFKWLLFSLIVVGAGIYNIVTYNIVPDFHNTQDLIMVTTSFIIPIGYIVGCILIAI